MYVCLFQPEEQSNVQNTFAIDAHKSGESYILNQSSKYAKTFYEPYLHVLKVHGIVHSFSDDQWWWVYGLRRLCKILPVFCLFWLVILGVWDIIPFIFVIFIIWVLEGQSVFTFAFFTINQALKYLFIRFLYCYSMVEILFEIVLLILGHMIMIENFMYK